MELVRQYRWKSPDHEIDMSDLSPQNYALKMHNLLYAEEESRQAVLSRWFTWFLLHMLQGLELSYYFVLHIKKIWMDSWHISSIKLKPLAK